MTRSVRFDVLGKPQAWQRTGGSGSRRFTQSATRDYEKLVRTTSGLACQGNGLRLRPIGRAALGDGLAYFVGPVGVKLAILYPDKRRRDVDNVLKSLFDGFQPQRKSGRKVGAGLLWDDDQIKRLEVDVGIDRERPRVEVTVWELGA